MHQSFNELTNSRIDPSGSAKAANGQQARPWCDWLNFHETTYKLLTFCLTRKSSSHLYNLTPVIIARVTDQFINRVALYSCPSSEILLKSSMYEINLSDGRLSKKSAAFKKITKNLSSIAWNIAQLSE